LDPTNYPGTADQVAAAMGGLGTWTSGWLGNSTSGNMTKLFGSVDLAPVSTPTYSQPGPFGDLAVGFNSVNDAFNGGNALDVDADDDIGIAWVAKHSTLAGTGDMVSKGWNGGLPAYLLAREGTEVSFNVRDATPDFVRVAATVPANTWYAGMAVLERTTNKSRIAICSLGGSPSASAESSTAAVGTLSNAFSFIVGDAAAYTADTSLFLSALYVAEDGACATSLSADLSTALSNFVAYISRR
jgi:hypothetical protein